ncbi:BREX-1 system adenine-specific DNA-methyltransferase PglX, partial [Ligilactobacillus equi]
MEKTKIKNFAVAARDSLIGSIKRAMFNYGVTEEGIQEKLPSSTREIEYYVNDERFALIGSKIKWRQKLVQELTDRQQKEDYLDAYNDLVEEVAYTWFNRIIAIRFMEVNNYLPSRVRVLSSEEGSVEPDIMKYALDLEDDLGKFTPEELAIIQRKRDTESQVDSDAMYEILFIKQADALGEILPHLFEKTTDYMKLLFTARYNAGVIKDLITTIP